MWRTLFLAGLLGLFSSAAVADDDPLPLAWQLCRGDLIAGATNPTLSRCRAMASEIIDPQGRELWLRAAVPARQPDEVTPSAIFIGGAASSQFWFNGRLVGSNGQPGPTADAEIPGLYLARVSIPEAAWQAKENELVVRLSSFHTGLRLYAPVGGIWIGPVTLRSPAYLLAITFAAAGALMAAVFGLGAIFVLRRTGSSLTLAAMAGVAALQAGVENLRSFVPYAYPLHVWRLGAIWLLAATFALLLVAFAAQRFMPRRRGLLLSMTAVAILAATWFPGFDQKTVGAVGSGVVLAGFCALLGFRDGRSGARPALAYLLIFAALALLSPAWFLDLSFFVLASGLTLPLLIVEVLRLGRDDRDREAALARAASVPDRLTVATARGVQLTPLKDIVAILGADDYAELRLTGDRSLLHAARLDLLETQLPQGFVRIHRSVIANLSHVERLEREGSRWRLYMREGKSLPVSRPRLAAVREALTPAQPATA